MDRRYRYTEVGVCSDHGFYDNDLGSGCPLCAKDNPSPAVVLPSLAEASLKLWMEAMDKVADDSRKALVVGDELRPPPEHEDKPFYWLESPDGTPIVSCYAGDEWLRPGGPLRISSKEASASGYRYLGPAEYRAKPSAYVMKEDGTIALLDQSNRITDLETENACLKRSYASAMARIADADSLVAFLKAQLASTDAHNVELVAKYETAQRALARVQTFADTRTAEIQRGMPFIALKHSR